MQIPRRGDVFVPSVSDRSSGIDGVLARTQPAFTAGEHQVRAVHATAPHHPTAPHTVYWIGRPGRDGSYDPWNGDSWERAATDKAFLVGVEKYLRGLQQADDQLRLYFFMGFLPPGSAVDAAVTYQYGLQSQERWHVHATHVITKDIPGIRFLSPENDHDRRAIARVMNVGAEASIRHYGARLAGFGERLVYRQEIGIREPFELPRTMFGFPSLAEALPAALELQSGVSCDWMDHARALAQESTSLAHLVLSHMQCPIPNMTVILPSAVDRKLGRVESDAGVWIAPFSVTGAQPMLAPGGVYIEGVPAAR